MLKVIIGGLLMVGVHATAQDEFSNSWGPEIGSQMPVFSLPDTANEDKSLHDVMGDKGALIFFNRSTVW